VIRTQYLRGAHFPITPDISGYEFSGESKIELNGPPDLPQTFLPAPTPGCDGEYSTFALVNCSGLKPVAAAHGSQFQVQSLMDRMVAFIDEIFSRLHGAANLQ
jgi:hypothetical protein